MVDDADASVIVVGWGAVFFLFQCCLLLVLLVFFFFFLVALLLLLVVVVLIFCSYASTTTAVVGEHKHHGRCFRNGAPGGFGFHRPRIHEKGGWMIVLSTQNNPMGKLKKGR